MGFANFLTCCCEQVINRSYEQVNLLIFFYLKYRLLITSKSHVDFFIGLMLMNNDFSMHLSLFEIVNYCCPIKTEEK